MKKVALFLLAALFLMGCASDKDKMHHDKMMMSEMAMYEVVFMTDVGMSNYAELPEDLHYSPLTGATHMPGKAPWMMGGMASPGFQMLCETGKNAAFVMELENMKSVGMIVKADGPVQPMESTFLHMEMAPPEMVKVMVKADKMHPELTLASMIAPSPDWFVGISGFPLMKEGKWIKEAMIELYAYDAGTRDGMTYEKGGGMEMDPHMEIMKKEGEAFVLGTLMIKRMK